jgi:hypothetical protein
MVSMPNVPPVPPSGFGRVRLLMVRDRKTLTPPSQTFLVGGTIVAVGLGGFYMNMLRRKRIEEERGTNPHGTFLSHAFILLA